MKQVKSARGVKVDFDLLKIKQDLGNAKPTIDVGERKKFIDAKLSRKLKKAKNALVDLENSKKEDNPSPTEADPKPETNEKQTSSALLNPTLDNVRATKPDQMEEIETKNEVAPVKEDETTPKKSTRKRRRITKKPTGEKND
jgi:hypothetical protein